MAKGQQVKQVVWNLRINALVAMTIDTLTIKLKEVSAYNNHRFYENRRGVVLKVVGQGGGIALDKMGSNYDPFYSNKKYGVRLCLSTVYNIVHRNEGTMDVKSTLE